MGARVRVGTDTYLTVATTKVAPPFYSSGVNSPEMMIQLSKEDVEKKIKGTLETAHIATIQKAIDHYAKAESKGVRYRNGLAKASGKTIIEINKVSQSLYKADFETLTLEQMEAVKGAL